jgi:hypothetical protein
MTPADHSMKDDQAPRASPSASPSPLVELRQYALQPGRRDVLIELFERALIETQEEVGLRVIGQFTDYDDPNRFVWIRGFADMDSRREGLESFYGGPVWAEHADAANATMIDSDNVFLLRAVKSEATFKPAEERPPVDAEAGDRGAVSAAIAYLPSADVGIAAVDLLESAIAPVIADSGGSLLGYFVSEATENDFPRLPVRENEPVLVWFAGFGDEPEWMDFAHTAAVFGNAGLGSRIDRLRLIPTARSLITGGTPSCSEAEVLTEASRDRAQLPDVARLSRPRP